MFFHQPGCMLCIQNYGGQHYVFRWTDNPWCEIASEQTTTSVQHHEGSSHLPLITICHTISTNGTAINSSEPNQQPKSRSAETQTVPLKLFFWEWNEPWPAIQRLSFPFLYRPKLGTPVSFRRVRTNTNPGEVTSTMQSWDSGAGLGRRWRFSEAFVTAMILKLCCNIPARVGVSFL